MKKGLQSGQVAMWIATNLAVGLAIWVTSTAWPLFALLVPLVVDLVKAGNENSS